MEGKEQAIIVRETEVVVVEMMSLFDSSDHKYDQPVVYLTNYLVYGSRSCFSADVFKSKLHELSRLYNTTKVYLTTEMILRTYKHPESSCKVTNRSSDTIEDGWN